VASTELDHAVIAAAVRQWCRGLLACIRAGGGHFEHAFNSGIVFLRSLKPSSTTRIEQLQNSIIPV